MKSLAQPACQQEIAARIAALTPSDRPRWGRMNVHQMICHVADAYRVPLGAIAITPPKLPIPPAVMKFAALRIPLRWRPGFPAPPEIAQDQQGKPPVAFESDRAALLAVLRDFCTRSSGLAGAHPFFGPMSGRDWQRWGYLHADHHLRQFGR